MEPSYSEVFAVEAGNFVTAGEASGKIKQLLRKLGVSNDIVRRVSISAYELEMNIVIHTHGGALELNIYPGEIQLISTDSGPGIPDIELAMREGYSTASESVRMMGFGAGMGLSNIKRCSDVFEIKSGAGQPTYICTKFILAGG